MIFSATALQLIENTEVIMSNLIIDAANDKIFLTIIDNKNVYNRTHENSKSNFEKLIVLINEFLIKNNNEISDIKNIYVNRGPGSFAGIRNSISIAKALCLSRKIDYYCYSLLDFIELKDIKHIDIPKLCNKFDVKKNLINPLYLS